jgi:hypothetical protein
MYNFVGNCKNVLVTCNLFLLLSTLISLKLLAIGIVSEDNLPESNNSAQVVQLENIEKLLIILICNCI